MERIVIAGGRPLYGKVRIGGAKNAALPILGATLLTESPCILREVPNLTDVGVMRSILQHLGAKVEVNGDTVTVEAAALTSLTVPEHLMREMRSSIIVMGALLTRFGTVKVSQPGGCDIGSRPIDLHIKGLKELGAEIVEKHGYITATCERLRGASIHLDFPSVGATQNLMMAATLAEGTTVITNAAKEPEIVDLQNFINSLGANIKGAGTDTIRIEGVEKLHGTDYTVIPDRIVAGTYLIAGAITGGQVTVENVIPEHLESLLAKLREMGVQVDTTGDSVTVRVTQPLKAIDSLRTLPYPGFPTDLQAPMMALLCVANGTSIVTETVFESRFKHVNELRRMGADIKVNERTAIIKGVQALSSANVAATDLRAGAALVLAGLAADGITVVSDVHHIYRGYVDLDENLRGLNARIERIGC
ncbi:MAG TPA: UDP-N-acetylglucosamine 1-carboxyvinyltransferase [Firmicutes bacterium]|nr:UDP-N-acetylglucosamine 1-carboxyvinyltransferase [Bacillota bacterium]